MKIDNLVPHIATGEANNSFVGMKIIGNQIHFYFPESYHFDAENFERDDFLDILKTISIAKSTSMDMEGTYDSHRNDNDLAILSYIWIMQDYLKNGFFANFEKTLKTNQKGRINWKKTLQQQPIVSGKNIIFQNLITEVKSPQDSILTEAYKYCVKKSVSLIGWIYGVTTESIEIIADSNLEIPRYLDAVKYEKDVTFDDEKRSRLLHMENVLIGLDEVADDNNIVYGVDSYHYVFERMIDSIFGTERVDDYYPSFIWHLKYSDKTGGQAGPTIRPDTIMKYGSEDDIYIIDSKFYRYSSLDLTQTKGLPEASSIVKQITYGSYVQSQHPDKNIYNIFILPYDSLSSKADIIDDENKRLVYIGNVSSGWENEKSYGTIYTFLIDLRYVVRTWNRLSHDIDKKNLVDQLKLITDNM